MSRPRSPTGCALGTASIMQPGHGRPARTLNDCRCYIFDGSAFASRTIITQEQLMKTARHCFAILLITLLPMSAFGFFGPSNFWECILDEMPGVKNDPAAIEVLRKCRNEFPSNASVEKKSPIFGVKTAGECVIENGKDVSSNRGAKLIRAACYNLYPR